MLRGCEVRLPVTLSTPIASANGVRVLKGRQPAAYLLPMSRVRVLRLRGLNRDVVEGDGSREHVPW